MIGCSPQEVEVLVALWEPELVAVQVVLHVVKPYLVQIRS